MPRYFFFLVVVCLPATGFSQFFYRDWLPYLPMPVDSVIIHAPIEKIVVVDETNDPDVPRSFFIKEKRPGTDDTILIRLQLKGEPRADTFFMDSLHLYRFGTLVPLKGFSSAHHQKVYFKTLFQRNSHVDSTYVFITWFKNTEVDTIYEYYTSYGEKEADYTQWTVKRKFIYDQKGRLCRFHSNIQYAAIKNFQVSYIKNTEIFRKKIWRRYNRLTWIKNKKLPSSMVD